MAEIIKRVWRSGPRRAKRVAYGYMMQLNGKQTRKFNSAWSEEDAEKALAAALLGQGVPAATSAPEGRTFGQVASEYLDFKRAKGKRSLADDELALTKRILPWFGAETPVKEITALRIAQYDRERSAGLSRLKRPVTPATVNRELALVRHLLRLAEEWGYIAKAPRVRLGKEPEGRLRFLTEPEALALLEACRTSQNPYLAAMVTTALYTGARRGEILGLTWERVDFARGVLLFDRTKSGRRREVPMHEPVYRVLAGVPGPKAEGPVFRKADGAAWGSIRTGFERACRAARLEDFRFHDLRHTCASGW